jgi:hypothetical protein
LIDNFEELAPKAESLAGLRFWARDRTVAAPVLSSQVVEETLFRQEADRLEALQDFQSLARALSAQKPDYERHALGYWGKLATHRIPWRELADLAGHGEVLDRIGSRSSTLWVLLSPRVPSGFVLPAFLAASGVFAAFFVEVAFLPDLPFEGATRGLRGATVGLVGAFGSWTAPEAAWAALGEDRAFYANLYSPPSVPTGPAPRTAGRNARSAECLPAHV